MKCHFVYDKKTGEKLLIPFCYGSMHREDLECCTCSPTFTFHQFEKQAYNKKLTEAKEWIDFLLYEIKDLHQYIEYLKLKNEDQSKSVKGKRVCDKGTSQRLL